MHKTKFARQLQDKGLVTLHSLITKLLGVKRLRDGEIFSEEVNITEKFMCDRQNNMGDLWREPSDIYTNDDTNLPSPSIDESK